ncbi:flagellar basal body rod protein FlgB [Alcanivorax sp. N3-2A]|nr:flagellar basal body rod protein FlgB [Alcanivorax sp. N3-2A]|tara:strand:- start:9733 stop:10149 length:417 start_codon:yes stop_codon:yes gene_type:complete
MIDQLSAALNFHQEALNLRAERQKVLAANIANADTPNYKARDFDFASELSQAMDSGRANADGLALATTSARHIPASLPSSSGVRDLLYRVPEQPSLDGNTVDMNRERVQFADNAVRYQAALSLLNGRIQGLKSAMQPE